MLIIILQVLSWIAGVILMGWLFIHVPMQILIMLGNIERSIKFIEEKLNDRK